MAPRVAGVLIAAGLFAGEGDREPASWGKLRETAEARQNEAEFAAARAAAGRGYAYWETQPHSRWHWLFRLALAESLVELNQPAEAERLLQVLPPETDLRGRWHVARALASCWLHRYEDTRQHLDAARHSGVGGDPQTAGKIDLIAGIVDLRAQRFDTAEASFRRALRLVDNSHTLVEGYALVNLGFVNLKQFRYDEAVFWFGRAREAAQQGKARRSELLATGNLGVAYFWLGDQERALKLLGDAVDLARSSGDGVYLLRWLVMLGELRHAGREYQQAAALFDEARSLAQAGGSNLWLFNAVHDRAELSLDTGDLDAAERGNDEALRLAQDLPNWDSRARSQVTAARIAAARHDEAGAEARFQQAIQTSTAAPDPLTLWKAHAGLAALYRAIGRNAEAGRRYRSAIETIEGERSKLRGDTLKFTFLENRIRFYQDYVDFLVDQGQTALAFAAAESSRARVLSEKLREPAEGIEPLTRLVRETGVVLMSYWLAPERSLLWVIDGRGLHQFTLPPQDAIARDVERYTRLIKDARNPLADKNDAGRRLFAALVGDHYNVPPEASVMVVPDGVLHRLNFESLPVGDSGRYWIQDASIAVAPSLELLRMAESMPRRRLLLLGDPDFASAEFPRLANVKTELAMVGSHFADKEVLAGPSATPAAYRGIHPERYSALHFAAHAVANREEPFDSAIILSGPEGSNKLYARDVMAQPLEADLVTLSACQTAGNRAYSGEGLTGLAWAFLSAGARHVVAGLWDVDDRGTMELMGRFYTALEAGQSPARALRQAKLEMIAGGGGYAKPFYWAPFETFTRVVYPRAAGGGDGQ